jgi:predicted amidophosphoribosyltransferase
MGTVTQPQMSTRILHSPRHGPDVCIKCFNLTRGFSKCFACSHVERHLDAIVPISYSVGHEYLHHILADYKRAHGRHAAAAGERVGAILSKFLELHEECVAQASGVERFGLVTTVPSSDAQRDDHHPLRRIVGDVLQTRDRHERLLRRTSWQTEPRTFDSRRYRAVRRLDDQNVLLIDDTWTTGASAQSAAAALKAAGAATVGAVVVGRHVNRDWHHNDAHLDALPFDWCRCAVCAQTAVGAADAARSRVPSRQAEPLEQAA